MQTAFQAVFPVAAMLLYYATARATSPTIEIVCTRSGPFSAPVCTLYRRADCTNSSAWTRNSVPTSISGIFGIGNATYPGAVADTSLVPFNKGSSFDCGIELAVAPICDSHDDAHFLSPAFPFDRSITLLTVVIAVVALVIVLCTRRRHASPTAPQPAVWHRFCGPYDDGKSTAVMRDPRRSLSRCWQPFSRRREAQVDDVLDCLTVVLGCANRLPPSQCTSVREAANDLFTHALWQPSAHELLSNPYVQPFSGWNAESSARFALALLKHFTQFHSLFTSLMRDHRDQSEIVFNGYLVMLLRALQQLNLRRDLAFTPCTVWCGMHVRCLADARRDYAVGREVQFHTFTSATRDAMVARNALPTTGVAVLFRIGLSSGRGCWDLASAAARVEAWFYRDREVLLSPDMRFSVVSHCEMCDNVIVIHMEEAHWKATCWE